MAELSKAGARAEIIKLSKELNLEPPANLDQIDKLDQLLPMIEELKAKKAATAGPTTASSTAPSPDGAPPAGTGNLPPPPVDIVERKLTNTTYAVKEGKVVTTKRGPIGAFEPVFPTDFNGGQAVLDQWVAAEYVTKTDHFE